MYTRLRNTFDQLQKNTPFTFRALTEQHPNPHGRTENTCFASGRPIRVRTHFDASFEFSITSSRRPLFTSPSRSNPCAAALPLLIHLNPYVFSDKPYIQTETSRLSVASRRRRLIAERTVCFPTSWFARRRNDLRLLRRTVRRVRRPMRNGASVTALNHSRFVIILSRSFDV